MVLAPLARPNSSLAAADAASRYFNYYSWATTLLRADLPHGHGGGRGASAEAGHRHIDSLPDLSPSVPKEVELALVRRSAAPSTAPSGAATPARRRSTESGAAAAASASTTAASTEFVPAEEPPTAAEPDAEAEGSTRADSSPGSGWVMAEGRSREVSSPGVLVESAEDVAQRLLLGSPLVLARVCLPGGVPQVRSGPARLCCPRPLGSHRSLGDTIDSLGSHWCQPPGRALRPPWVSHTQS